MKESQDSESGRVWFEPGLQGAIGAQVPGYVDLSLWMRAAVKTRVVNNQTTQVTERVLITQPDGQHNWIKDRSGKLPAEFEVNFEDDFDRIYELIFGGVDLPDEEGIDLVSTPGRTEADREPEPEPGPAPTDVTESAAPEQTTVSEPTPEPTPAETPVEITPPTAIQQPSEVAPVKPAEVAGDRVCEECGDAISDDQADLSRIRFRRPLCREHFLAAKKH
jgi:hypothetical protein